MKPDRDPMSSAPTAMPVALALIAALTLAAPGAAATFTDVAAEAGLATSGGSSGAAWGDYDADGCVDLYVSGTPNRLYRNDCGGGFADVTADAGVAGPLDGSGVAWADYDGDGDLDLFVSSRSAGDGNRLYRNEGDGDFSDATPGSGLDEAPDAIRAAGVSWADYDGDGDLDLFVANRFGDETFDKTDRLYRNDGDGTFTEAGAAAGVAGADDRLSFTGAWADFDADADVDLYLSVDFDDDVYYRNNGDGTFTDASLEANVDDPQHGMGVALGDPNHDGRIDVASTNNGQSDTDPTHGSSVLYRNDGGVFRDVTENAQLLDRDTVEWGINFVDYDNDGDDDLSIVSGGMLSEGEPNVLYENPGNGKYEPVTAATGTENEGGAFGSIWADYDDDGDLDWFVANETGSNVLFRNDGPVGGHLEVRLRGVLSNRFGVGAQVEALRPGDPDPLLRVIQAGESYLSAEEPLAFFGLGDGDADAVTVRWPSGVIDQLGPQVAGTALEITEGEAMVNGFLFHDGFDDGVLDPGWVYGFGRWAEADGVLGGRPGGNGVAAALALGAFGGCEVCTLEARLEADDGVGAPDEIQFGLFGWFQSLQQHVVVILRPEVDTLIFRQVDGGVPVNVVTTTVPIDQGVAYDVAVDYDGATFRVRLDGEMVVETPNAAAGQPAGSFGVAARFADVMAHDVRAYRIDP